MLLDAGSGKGLDRIELLSILTRREAIFKEEKRRHRQNDNIFALIAIDAIIKQNNYTYNRVLELQEKEGKGLIQKMSIMNIQK